MRPASDEPIDSKAEEQPSLLVVVLVSSLTAIFISAGYEVIAPGSSHSGIIQADQPC